MPEPNDVEISLADLTPDKSYGECLQLCKDLGLLETVQHGGQEYGRFTQNGINALICMLRVASYRQNPKNVLKQS